MDLDVAVIGLDTILPCSTHVRLRVNLLASNSSVTRTRIRTHTLALNKHGETAQHTLKQNEETKLQ